MRSEDRAKAARANWQGYVIAVVLVAAIIAVLFFLKISTGATYIEMRALILGMVCGAAVSVLLFRLKKPVVLAVLAAVLYALWFTVPAEMEMASTLLGGAAVCCAALIPAAAALLTPKAPGRPKLSELEKMTMEDL